MPKASSMAAALSNVWPFAYQAEVTTTRAPRWRASAFVESSAGAVTTVMAALGRSCCQAGSVTAR
jgi:hypothetical protein